MGAGATLEWNLRTFVAACDPHRFRDPAWDAAAREAVDTSKSAPGSGPDSAGCLSLFYRVPSERILPDPEMDCEVWGEP